MKQFADITDRTQMQIHMESSLLKLKLIFLWGLISF